MMKLNEMAIANIVFAVTGLLLGFLSPVITRATNLPAYNLIALVAVIFALKFGMGNLLKIKQPMGWWFSNGILICTVIWFLVWTVLFNI
jgi:hypothetical protein